MKLGYTLFLKVIICLIALGVFVGMLRLPLAEGRAVNLDLISIYRDPFVIYCYIASIPFFTALYQAIKLLGLIEKDKLFSKNAIQALNNIKNCALLLIGFIIGAATFIRFNAHPDDDPAGFIALCIISLLICGAVLASSLVLKRIIEKRIAK